MTAVQFSDGAEPIAVYADGRLGPWLHVRIDDTGELSKAQLGDLGAWLADVGVDRGELKPAAVLVSHDGSGGYEVHIAGRAYPVGFKSMPAWLQAPQSPKPRKAGKP